MHVKFAQPIKVFQFISGIRLKSFCRTRGYMLLKEVSLTHIGGSPLLLTIGTVAFSIDLYRYNIEKRLRG
ncbi:MAG: hypothetical protein QXV24_00400 [Nitrososphaerota archaeon]